MESNELTIIIKGLLKRYGIRRNGSYAEYERGKQIIQDQGYSPALYLRAVTILAAWVGV